MTGAGRSTAAKELEDLGFFVVDNLPPQLVRRRRPAGRRDAAARRSRSPSWSTSAPGRSSTGLQERARPAASPAGARRCCSSRPPTTCWCAARRPPGGRTRCRRAAGCSTGCAASARCWPTCAADADLVIDTTALNVHQLTDQGRAARSAPEQTTSLKVTVVSFGFKYGIPVDADLRRRHALPAQPALGARAARRRPAATPTVGDYVKGRPDAQEFLDQLRPGARRPSAPATSARASGS